MTKREIVGPVGISRDYLLLTEVEKIFYFPGPERNIENFLQVIKLIDTRIPPLYDTHKLQNEMPCNNTDRIFSAMRN